MSNAKLAFVKYMMAFKLFFFVAILFSATPALAFDDNRQGFILGLGAGLHSIGIDVLYDGSKIESQSESGIATSFKLGGGITDQFALYYVRNASWYSAPFSDGFRTKDATYTIGLSGIGASYFLAPSAPSGYFMAALGIGDISAPFENVRSDTGDAFMFGGGYEFKSHLMMEVTLLTTNIKSADDNRFKIKSSSFQFTLNYLFY